MQITQVMSRFRIASSMIEVMHHMDLNSMVKGGDNRHVIEAIKARYIKSAEELIDLGILEYTQYKKEKENANNSTKE